VPGLLSLFKLVAFLAFPEQVYALLVSLALSFPFSVLGVIAITLIAAGGDWNFGEPSAHRKWRQLVRVFMALHFDGRDER
jgi:hypothetical protein